MALNDAHCHFFSDEFFRALSRQRGRDETPGQLCDELQWDAPDTPDRLADRWVRELDRHGVARATLMASVPNDEASVARAVARHPDRLVGFFMLDPSAADAVDRARRGVTDLGLRAICLFPAMHHVPLDDGRVARIVDAAAARPGTAVFVHCGMLSVGVRKKLGLPSRFDLRLGDPLAVARLAQTFPHVPFVIPHFGAGMFRETLMAAESCGNVLLDTSRSNRWIGFHPGLTLDSVFRSAISVAGASRLLFGTDSSFFPRGWQQAIYAHQQTILENAGVSETEQALIFGDNFDRLFPPAHVEEPA